MACFLYVVTTKKRIFIVTIVFVICALIWIGDISSSLLPGQIKPVGVGTGGRLYGVVPEQHLPWYTSPAAALCELLSRYGSYFLVSAFRTTLPDPLYQEEENVAVAAKYLAGTVVLPGEVFSLNQAIGKRTKARGFAHGPVYINGYIGSTIGGGICKVATTMYNVAMLCGLQIIERHPHSMLVPYIPPGRDATIVWGAKDFRFRNDQDCPLIIWSEVHDQTLFIAMYGQYDPPLVEWHSEELTRRKTWTIKRQNPSLAAGEVREMEGYDGVTVHTWVWLHYPDQPVKKMDLGVDYYLPMPGLIEYGI